MYFTYFPLHGSTLIFCWCFYLDFDWLTTLLLHSVISVSYFGDSFPLWICFLCIYFAGGCYFFEHSEGILVCSRRDLVPFLALSKVFLPCVYYRDDQTTSLSAYLIFFFSTSFSRLISVSFRGFLLLSTYASGYYCLILIDCLPFVVFLKN